MHNTKRMTPPPSFSQVFSELKAERSMSPLIARRVFDAVLAGGWTPVQIGALLVAIDLLGQSAALLAPLAKAIRAKMVPVEHDYPLLFDTCGTGGDGKHSINISTAAAIIVAAAGVPVAKHGNRSSSSRVSSADVLVELGVPVELPPAAAASILAKANIAFLFAQAHHPAMKYVQAPRRELGVATLFNLIGPLVNPASATHQLVGTFADEFRAPMAAALASLGVKAAWVVHSEDGLDEISPYAPTRVSVLARGKIEEGVVSPKDFGLEPSPMGSIEGGDAKRNAAILREVLSGKPHPARDACVINAAACLAIAKDLRLRDAAELAQQTLATGRALACLEAWRAAARAHAGA